MINFKTPGVYIRDVEVAPPTGLRLDITGFVGGAERGPLNYPQPITSWGQFSDIFGDFVGFSYLPYAVFGFFLNGGQRCYVVRVTHETAKKATLDLVDKKNAPAIRVEAIDAGNWGNAIEVTVDEQSSGDLILTELADDIDVGQKTVRFKSVAGLAETDVITLIHRISLEKLTIEQVDFETKTVTFTEAVSHKFPAGSSVIDKGVKLTFRYQPNGKLVREEVFDNLSMDDTHERYFVRVINSEPEEKNYVKRIRNGNSILVRLEDLCRNSPTDCSRPESVEAKALENGDDRPRNFGENGHRYYTGYDNGAYFRPIPPDADEGQLKEIEEKLFGLAAFEAVEEIGLIAIPDLIIPDFYAVTPEVQILKEGILFAKIPFNLLKPENLKVGQRDMLAHCEKMGDRFAILDSPRGAETGRSANRIEEWPSHFQLFSNAKYGALYYPWIQEKTSDFEGRDLFIPPSGHIAGIYGRTEQERGVGKAPANETLQGIVELEFGLSDAEQEVLNPRGVNCLRIFPGRGLRVWGARTLSLDPLWRYVNVRRVCLSIIKHIIVNLQWTVFEPNDRRLWDNIVASLTQFFRDLFQSGALAGTSPEEAFFVKCDEETNPPEVVDRGQVITHIGFAPARPAEFILVTIKRTGESLSVSERT